MQKNYKASIVLSTVSVFAVSCFDFNPPTKQTDSGLDEVPDGAPASESDVLSTDTSTDSNSTDSDSQTDTETESESESETDPCPDKERVDECTSGSHLCDLNATCEDTPCGYECTCNEGYEGDGFSCDLDECYQGLDDCDPLADCENDLGGFTCACPEGSMGDGQVCQLKTLQISVGDDYACWIRSDGTLWCHGTNRSGQLGIGTLSRSERPGRVGEKSDWIAISADEKTTCGIRETGTLWCWGDNEYGQLSTGTKEDYRTTPVQIGKQNGWLSVAVGDGHICATRSGNTLWCWGNNSKGQLGTGDFIDQTSPTQVAKDASYESSWQNVVSNSCGLLHGGTLMCWGDGVASPEVFGAAKWKQVDLQHGRKCGIQTDNSLWCWGGTWGAEPVRVGEGTSWEKAAGGNEHACAIKEDGSLWCWGNNKKGALGTGNGADQPDPLEILPGTTWTDVDTGWSSCAIRSDGILHCWGATVDGRYDYSVATFASPVLAGVGTDWQSVSARTHTCGVRRDGTLWCWGDNTWGQLGMGIPYGDWWTPSRVGEETDWTQVSVGSNYTCGIRAKKLYCWGGGGSGRLGTGSSENVHEPTSVGDANWDSVSTFNSVTCGIQEDNSLWCWGDAGLIGDGSNTEKNTPQPVAKGSSWLQVSVGYSHACAIRSDHTLFCWGSNQTGQVGLGSEEPIYGATQIGSADDWQIISAGYLHTCGIRNGGELWCWGSNTKGELGNGTLLPRNEPVRIGKSANWLSVSSANSSTCALRQGFGLWCWGSNEYGQLGIGLEEKTVLRPKRVGSAKNWISVKTATGYTIALDAHGRLHSWGNNKNGELGNGTTNLRSEPGLVGLSSGWSQITAGGYHTCSIRTDGDLYCWGDPANYSSLGDSWIRKLALPTRIGDGKWKKIASGKKHQCGIASDNTIYCWGIPAYGTLGTGKENDIELTPVQIDANTDWFHIAAGRYATCGIRNNASSIDGGTDSGVGEEGGTLWCWGYYMDGTGNNQLTPKQLGTASDWLETSVGSLFACALNNKNEVWCWGDDSYLGLKDTFMPTLYASGWKKLGAGEQHACGITISGELYCWGENGFGELGLGDTVNRSIPTKVGNDTDWTNVWASLSFSCARKANGTIWCWGTTWESQAGEPVSFDFDEIHVPQKVGSDSDWREMALGDRHSCALKTNGEIYCFGDHSYGTFGNGTDPPFWSPMPIVE